MRSPEADPPDIDRLLSALCDTGLSPSQMARLNRLLRSDPEFRRRYVAYLGVHATLQQTIGSELPRESEWFAAPQTIGRDAAYESIPRRPRPRRLWPIAAAAAVLIIGLAVPVARWLRRPEAPAPPGPIVGRVSGGAGTRFDPAGLSAGVGEPVRAGEYRLVEGIVQMTFARGAEVMIAAPAEFAAQAPDRLVLRCGKLSARVPEPAKGFVVETPSATLTDLGTEFAMDVDRAKNGEVHVFRGEVIVQPRSQTDVRPVKLVGAHATRIDAASATPAGIDVDASRFLRRLNEPETAYSRLSRGLGPGAYLTMEPTLDGISLIDAGSRRPVGRVVTGPGCGTPWSPGRFGASLRLRGPGFDDFAIVPLRPDQVPETLTGVAWVLAQSRPRWASILKRWGKPEDHSFHFGLYLDDGDLEVHTATADGQEFFAREGKPLPAGRWQHVAFVADRRELRLYRNGVEVAKTAHPGLRPGALDAIGLGVKLNITGDGPDPIEPGFWHGRLDEIAIYPRALGADEIRRLYEAAAEPEGGGRP